MSERNMGEREEAYEIERWRFFDFMIHITNRFSFRDINLSVLYDVKDKSFECHARRWRKSYMSRTEVWTKPNINVVAAKLIEQESIDEMDFDYAARERSPTYQFRAETLYNALTQESPNPQVIAEQIDALWLADRETTKHDILYARLRTAGVMGGRFEDDKFFGIVTEGTEEVVTTLLENNGYRTNWASGKQYGSERAKLEAIRASEQEPAD